MGFTSTRRRNGTTHIASSGGDVVVLFQSYRWPGNVLELRNVLEGTGLQSRKEVSDHVALEIILRAEDRNTDVAFKGSKQEGSLQTLTSVQVWKAGWDPQEPETISTLHHPSSGPWRLAKGITNRVVRRQMQGIWPAPVSAVS
jgi:transcriptional regulator with AAA-type ATPase domain